MRYPRRRPEHGFSIIEMMLAIGIFGAVVLGVSSALVTYKKTELFRRERLSRGIDYGFAQSAILLDLSDASPSFGFMIQNDDFGRNFFDFYPDVPDSTLPGYGVTALSRTLTLDTISNRTFKVIIIDRVRKPSVKIAPSLAYSYAGGSVSQTSTATYTGVNAGNIILDRAPAQFWREGAGLVLVSPSFQRPALPVNQTLAYGIAPRTHSFGGFISGDDVVYRGDWGGAMDTRYSLDTSRIIDSADKFLWWLPVIGGAGVYALAVPVQYLQFHVERQPTGLNDRQGNPIFNYLLIREEWNGTSLQNRFVMAQNVMSVTLKRNSVSSPLIGISFGMLEKDMAR